jgi:hypothetical protein
LKNRRRLISFSQIFIYKVVGGDKIDKAFTISIVVDKKDYLPIIFQYSEDSWKNNKVARYVFLARPTSELNGKFVPIGTPPANYNESIIFLEQMLQYKIFTDLADIQNHQTSFTYSKKSTEDVSKGNISINESFKLSDQEKIEKEKILDIFSNRIFLQSLSEKNRWDFGIGLRVPKGTKLFLDSVSSQENIQIGQYKIILENTDYFRIEFIIESLGSSTSIPREAVIEDKELAKRCETYYFKIRLNAIFHNMETGNPKAAEYKKWAEWLFEELRKINYSN